MHIIVDLSHHIHISLLSPWRFGIRRKVRLFRKASVFFIKPAAALLKGIYLTIRLGCQIGARLIKFKT